MRLLKNNLHAGGDVREFRVLPRIGWEAFLGTIDEHLVNLFTVERWLLKFLPVSLLLLYIPFLLDVNFEIACRSLPKRHAKLGLILVTCEHLGNSSGSMVIE